MAKYIRLFLVVFCLFTVVVATLYFGAKVYTAQKIEAPFATNVYACATADEFSVQYFSGPKQPPQKAGERPEPTGYVVLSFSNGRQLTLHQTLSASGVRYANADESILLWEKGNRVLYIENGFSSRECLEVTSGSAELPIAYASSTLGVTARLPDGFIVVEKDREDPHAHGQDILGVKFVVPKDLVLGTNLSSDSYVSIEEAQDTRDCSASKFLLTPTMTELVTDGDIQYSVASSTDAGAGNRYEEWIYALPNSEPCKAVHYFIHYSVFENYPIGSVKEFDHMAILQLFDTIRRTIIFIN